MEVWGGEYCDLVEGDDRRALGLFEVDATDASTTFDGFVLEIFLLAARLPVAAGLSVLDGIGLGEWYLKTEPVATVEFPDVVGGGDP